MIISDLSHVESISQQENTMIVGGGSITVGTFASAVGEFVKVINNTFGIIQQLPGGGEIGIGLGIALAVEYTPPSK